jgi:hypothetical protein
MSRKDKLLHRFCNIPSDFTFDELTRLLSYFGYSEVATGKTSGSRVVFVNIYNSDFIKLHKPHPQNVLKKYQITQVIDSLKMKGLL